MAVSGFQPRPMQNALLIPDWEGANNGSCFISAALQFLLSSPQVDQACRLHMEQNAARLAQAAWKGLSLQDITLSRAFPERSLRRLLHRQDVMDLFATTHWSVTPTDGEISKPALPILFLANSYCGSQEDAMEFLRGRVVDRCPLLKELVTFRMARPEICCAWKGCSHSQQAGVAAAYNAADDVGQWEWSVSLATAEGIMLHMSIQEALNASLSDESLDDQYIWDNPCPEHGRTKPPVKRQRLLQEPKVLLLHLTTYVGGHGISDFTINPVVTFGSSRYELVGCLMHKGVNTSGGHYRAVRRESLLADAYHVYDDLNTSGLERHRLSLAEVVANAKNTGWRFYACLYERPLAAQVPDETSDDTARRDRAREAYDMSEADARSHEMRVLQDERQALNEEAEAYHMSVEDACSHEMRSQQAQQQTSEGPRTRSAMCTLGGSGGGGASPRDTW